MKTKMLRLNVEVQSEIEVVSVNSGGAVVCTKPSVVLRLEGEDYRLKVGERATITLSVDRVEDH